MARILTSRQVEAYESRGAVFPIPVISTTELSRFRSGFRQVEKGLGGRLPYLGWSHLFFRWAYELALQPAIVDAAAEAIGPEVLVQGTLILCKYPNDPSYVSWHQDGTYTDLQSAGSVSAWVALTDSTPENGCMRVIPGSHRLGLLPHVETRASNNLLKRGERVEAEVDEGQAVDVVLRAGEMSLHQCTIIHGSRPNLTESTRIGFIVRFVTPRFRPAGAPLIRARGNADCNHLDLLAGPPSFDIDTGISGWKEFVRQRENGQPAAAGSAGNAIRQPL